MDETDSYRPFLFPTFLLILGGWGGLYALLNLTEPTLWARWSFFALVVVSGTGTMLPFVYLLNRLFSPRPSVDPRVITRQAIWFGIYLAMLAWLSIGRILNFSIGLWLALGLAAIEYLMRAREIASTSHNVPPQPPLR